MGLHNRITEQKYNEAKRSIGYLKEQCTAGELDETISELYKIGKSSARNIRLTGNYQEYCERVFRFHGHPGKKSRNFTETTQMLANPPESSRIYDDTQAISDKLDFYFDRDIAAMRSDQDLIIENQINLDRKLRIYIILDCILVFAMAATIALLAWRGSW